MFKQVLAKFFSIVLGAVMVLGLTANTSVATYAQNSLTPTNICPNGDCPLIGDEGNVGATNAQGVADIILSIARIITFVAVALAVLFMVIGGVMFVTDDGSGDRAGKGKTILINATIGLIIVILAYTIVSIVANVFQGDFSDVLRN